MELCSASVLLVLFAIKKFANVFVTFVLAEAAVEKEVK